MDNNNNNYSGFVPNNDTDDDCTFLQTLLELDPQHFYLPTEEFVSLSLQQQQQNDPFGVEKGNNVPFLQGNNNNDFPIGEGVVPDVVDVEEEGPPRRTGKEPIPEGQGDRFFIHGHDIFFFGEGGVGNNVDPPQENQTQPPNNQDVRSLCSWPPPPEPFSCSCCEVLRQINYTNGDR